MPDTLTVRGIPTAPTHDERVRYGKQDRTTWRLFVRDDVSGWDITGPPYPSRAVALSRVDQTARDYYGDDDRGPSCIGYRRTAHHTPVLAPYPHDSLCPDCLTVLVDDVRAPGPLWGAWRRTDDA